MNTLLEQTIQRLYKLPESKQQEVSDFVEFLLKRMEDESFIREATQQAAHSKAFDFLEQEPDLYSEDDLKERF